MTWTIIRTMRAEQTLFEHLCRERQYKGPFKRVQSEQ